MVDRRYGRLCGEVRPQEMRGKPVQHGVELMAVLGAEKPLYGHHGHLPFGGGMS